MSRPLHERNAADIPPEKMGVTDVMVDNDSVRIMRNTVEPGKQTGWHVHDNDYVAILITPAELRSEISDGTVTTRTITPGLFENSAVTHNVANVGDVVHIGFEIEFKR